MRFRTPDCAPSHSRHSKQVYHHGGGINGFTAALRYVQFDGAEAYTITVLDNTQSETTVQTAEALQALLAPSSGGMRPALE